MPRWARLRNGLLGKDAQGKDKVFSNELPPGDGRPNRQRLVVTPVETGNYFQPYPDPGEPYGHVMKQLYNGVPRAGLPSGSEGASEMPIPMEGFLADYIENFKADMKRPPTAAEYQQFMQCYPTQAVPVLSTLAEQFAVFDRWFCAVPSQTWCNRAFWNAGTSWGWVVNPIGNAEYDRWFSNAKSATLFNQIEDCGYALAGRFIAMAIRLHDALVHFLLSSHTIPTFGPTTLLPAGSVDAEVITTRCLRTRF